MVSRGYDIIVVGAGFAGAATARALVAAGVRNVLVIDREPVAGAHSSGRNAGLVRRLTEDPEIAPLAREGAAAIAALDVPFYRTGSWLLGAASRIPSAVLDATRHRRVAIAEALERVPILEREVCEGIVETPDDGIVEIHALLTRYLEDARDGGATVRLGAEGVRPRIGGRGDRRHVEGVETTAEFIPCRDLVVANGAWAASWGELAGVPIAMTPYRRHLVTTTTGDWASREWPWVWDLAHGYYFRWESAGLLWSPCDDLADAPGDARADDDVAGRLARRVGRLLPKCSSLKPLHHWAGHRTLTPDRRFVLGPDPRLSGWHWAAGLGGHGVTVSAAVGGRVAGAVLGRQTIEPTLGVRPAVLDAPRATPAGEGIRR